MSEDKLDLSKMASTELPGRGKFFLYNSVSRDKKYGLGGSVWIVGSEAVDKLAGGGINTVLASPKSKESAAPLIIVQEKGSDDPGLAIDYYNNPDFGNEDWEDKSNRAKGIVDSLASGDKRDPLINSVREMLRGVVRGKAYNLAQNSDKTAMSVTNFLLGDVSDPEKVIQNVFDGYDYQIVKGYDATDHYPKVEISLPLKQFLG